MPGHFRKIRRWIAKVGLLIGICLLLYPLLGGLAPTIERLPDTQHPLLLYSNQMGEDLRSMYLKAVEEATQSIELIIYTFTDRSLLHALKQKALEGVSVWVVCDQAAFKGSWGRLPDNFTLVKRGGVGLTHPKILVVDGKKVWIGSANFTRDSLDIHGNIVMGLHAPSFARHLRDKVFSMNPNGDSLVLQPLTFSVQDQSVEFWMLPEAQEAVERMKKLFRQAKKTIHAALFTWTRKDFAEEMVAAQQRGVQVVAVLDHTSGLGASAPVVRRLLDAGVDTRLSLGRGLLHHKFALMDGEVLVHGSANWTYAAFQKNDDCFCIVKNLSLAQQGYMKNLFQQIVRESGPADLLLVR